MVYWGVNQIYRYSEKSKNKDDSEMIKEINSLKQRVELLEKKLDKNG
jgi:hypothetical protein